jgi:hypothetical protein
MELRLQLQARATTDTDIIVIPAAGVSIVDALRDALTEPYLDFAFRLANVRAIGDTPAQGMEVKMTYKNKAWATLRLEASPPEAHAAESETISAFSLTQLGLNGPEQVTCQSLRYQMATKLHAVTERFPDRENDRFRDLIDLLLLRELEPDLGRVAEACHEIFDARAKHSWPPRLIIEPSWPEQYRALALDQAFPIDDVQQAVELVTALIDELAAEGRRRNGEGPRWVAN